MRTIPCEALLCQIPADYMVKDINKLMADAGHGVRLALAEGGEAAKISLVDYVEGVAQARGVIFFVSGELTAHNSHLMDYSVLLTGSPSPLSHRTMNVTLGYQAPPYPCLRHGKKAKTRFCAFIQRHRVERRDRFVRKLGRHKKVDCPGACLNNMEPLGASAAEAIEFMSGRKFTVTFENSAYPGYITEKIYMALAAGSVPIYSGSPTIARHVNPEAFINVDDFPTVDEAIAHIIRVDRDPRLYERYLNAEPILDNSLLRRGTKESLALFLKWALDRVLAGQKPRRSYFIRFYRRVYLFFYKAYSHCFANWAITDGRRCVQGIPLHRMALSWRVWRHGVPFILRDKAAYLVNRYRPK